MNIETANRLYELRKKYGYSQEELAAKLGLSRQAVSKWERAEASPDTDNLVELAKIYNVSLDELLNINSSSEYCEKNKHVEETPTEDKEEDDIHVHVNTDDTKINLSGKIHIEDGEDKVHISRKGIHVESEDGDSVHISLKDGVHVRSEDGEEVRIDGSGIHITDKDGNKVRSNDFNTRRSGWKVAKDVLVPLTVFGSLIAYLIISFTIGGIGWASYWVLFLLIPLVATLLEAGEKKQFTHFAYPVLVVAVYCFIGIRFQGFEYTFLGVKYNQFWHPFWFLFLTIPVYYIIFDPIDRAIRNSYRRKNPFIKFEENDDDEDED